MQENTARLKGFKRENLMRYISVVSIVVLALIFNGMQPNFLGTTNITSMLRDNAALLVMAVGHDLGADLRLDRPLHGRAVFRFQRAIRAHRCRFSESYKAAGLEEYSAAWPMVVALVSCLLVGVILGPAAGHHPRQAQGAFVHRLFGLYVGVDERGLSGLQPRPVHPPRHVGRGGLVSRQLPDGHPAAADHRRDHRAGCSTCCRRARCSAARSSALAATSAPRASPAWAWTAPRSSSSRSRAYAPLWAASFWRRRYAPQTPPSAIPIR